MKRLIWLTLILALLPTMAMAQMGDYCSAPPYVTRSIAPNIMVLMDNSLEMYGPAYTEAYDPSTTYIGYFVPTSCYSYSNKFIESLKAPVNGTVTCTAAAPYRGNLMNWATMSKYDVLQKVLIGGNSTSKQANANTLLSIGGAFNEKVYNGCRFQVSDANLTITEASAGACSLLNPAAAFADNSLRRSIPNMGTLIDRLHSTMDSNLSQIAAHKRQPNPAPPAPSVLATAIAAVGGVIPSAELAAIWENASLITKAWGATCDNPVLVTGLTATVGTPYSLRLNGMEINANNTVHTWTTTKPAWLSAPTYVHTTKITNYGIVWTGTPDTVGTYTVTARYTSNNCSPGSSTITYTINVLAAPIKITTPASTTTTLPSGTLGVPYNFDLFGQGGVKPMTWSASGLPAGLSINTESDAIAGQNSYVGHITGTPTTAGTNNVTITLSDSDSPPRSVSTASLNLTIFPGLTITTNSLPDGTVGVSYSPSMAGVGGVTPYSWSITAGTLPAGISMNAAGVFSGTINATATLGAYPFTVRLQDNVGSVVTKDLNMTVIGVVGQVMISTTSPLPTAYKGVPYTVDIVGTGGSLNYTWTIVSGAPPGNPAMTISSVVGSRTAQLTWTPTNNNDTTYNNIVIRVVGGGGLSHERTFSITSLKNAPRQRSASFNVKVDIDEESLGDLNGNDIWDLGETYVDSNGNGKWDGKQGLFQKFWDENIPKARWGMTKFGKFDPEISCIPASPVASWYTGIQNATPADVSPLASGLYAAINYYSFNNVGYRGCNSDPIDNIPCRKNFILVISAGADVSGTAYAAGTASCNQTDPLVRNACVAYKTDLRSTSAGKQNVYTYVVNTMGTNAGNNAILNATATAGGGKYYDASNAATLETQLTAALQDILSQAASGTAVSVLTTSSRGIGSMVQAYFLPVRTDGTREVTWTGYTQDLWIDPQDNLREDSVQNLQLDIGDDAAPQDKVIKLFFDTTSNETKVARFTTEEDGSGGTLASCVPSDVEPFSATKYLWEAGQKLALKNPDTRTLMTSKKVIHGTTTKTFGNPTFKAANVVGNATMKTALNVEAPYNATEIVEYVRGVDKESADLTKFRDRRLTVDGSLRVWKLGDIISSTPKVFANTPANTYHIDYGDSSYYSYVTSAAYKQRSSVAFVGANAGVLHAFRVGYLKDTGLTAGIKGIFKNAFDVADNVNTEIGQEMWGFIPFNAFPYLQYLANPGYCHIYFNDLSVRIVDASVGAVDVVTDPAAVKTTASWRSILIGGMRFGGACDGGAPSPPALAGAGYSAYYALDITDPENPIPLWEFSDPDMGHATSFPSIVRTGGKNSNGSWYVTIGSGSTRMPKSSTDLARDKDGFIYFLDLKSGELIKKIGLGHNAIVSDIVAIDSQKDASVDNIYFGTSYRPTATTWGGKLMSLNVAGNVPNLCGTGVTRTSAECGTTIQKVIFNGAFPFTASPDVARDTSGNIWIYAGAGKYVSDLDEADDSDQIFLGIKAKFADGTSPDTIQIGVTPATDFIDRSTVTTTGTVTSTRKECLYNPGGSGSTQFTLQEVVTGIAPDPSAITVPPKGWYLILTQGERVISRPLAVGGLVDFLTYKPDNDLCSYGGSTYLYAVDYQKGVAPTNVAIRAPATTNNVTSGAVTIKKGILLGPGAPPTGEAITIPPPKEGQEQLKKKIQVATGVIVEAENTPVISTISKVVHWLKK